MQSVAVETSFAVKKEGSDFAAEVNDFASAASPQGTRDLTHGPAVPSAAAAAAAAAAEDRIPDSVDEDGESCNDSKQLVLDEPNANGSHESASVRDSVNDNHSGSVSKELVLYDPKANVTHESVLSPEPLHSQLPVLGGCAGSNMPSRVLPAVGAYTVQCANCFKWRLIPTKAKYEVIREHILDQPFVCDNAQEWRPEISCDEPPDIQQDDSRVWAIDKPSIAKPPPGWERELRIRAEGGSRFADVYYIAPSGKKLRSMVEVQKYLLEHPEHIQEGVKLSRFSFQIPRPLQENYVRKRSRMTTSCNDTTLTASRPIESNEVGKASKKFSTSFVVSPLSLAAPVDSTVLRLPDPELSDAYDPETLVSSNTRPLKQQRQTHSPPPSSERLHNRIKIKIGYPHPSTDRDDAA